MLQKATFYVADGFGKVADARSIGDNLGNATSPRQAPAWCSTPAPRPDGPQRIEGFNACVRAGIFFPGNVVLSSITAIRIGPVTRPAETSFGPREG